MAKEVLLTKVPYYRINLENYFKLSKSAKEFRCQILKWDEPACQYQNCVLCTLNALLYNSLHA